MRRSIIALALVLFVCAPLLAQEKPITPDVFWNALLRGNQEYVAGKLTYDTLAEERKQFEKAQAPPMTILACSDSRVPPELVFNQSLGTLFVVRAAGSIADTFALASIEYAIDKGWTHLIVVLGHENCGAVHDSLTGNDPGSPNLLALAQRVRASFAGIPYKPDDPAVVKRAVEANTRASAAYLLAQSAIVRKAVSDGRVMLVTAYYEMGSGKVTRLE